MISDYRQALWSGLQLSVEITVLSITVPGCSGRLVGCRPAIFLGRAVLAYVEVIRNVPSVVKVFFLSFVVGLDALPAAVIGLALHQAVTFPTSSMPFPHDPARAESEPTRACPALIAP